MLKSSQSWWDLDCDEPLIDLQNLRKRRTWWVNCDVLAACSSNTAPIWVFPKIVVPQNHPFYQGFRYKPSILGYPYFGNTHIGTQNGTKGSFNFRVGQAMSGNSTPPQPSFKTPPLGCKIVVSVSMSTAKAEPRVLQPESRRIAVRRCSFLAASSQKNRRS